MIKVIIIAIIKTLNEVSQQFEIFSYCKITIHDKIIAI